MIILRRRIGEFSYEISHGMLRALHQEPAIEH
jgi:hypothetical protein